MVKLDQSCGSSEDELGMVNPGETAMPPSMQWSRKLSHEMMEHLAATTQNVDVAVEVDLYATLKAMAETLMGNVMGAFLDQTILQKAADATSAENTGTSTPPTDLGEQVIQLTEAALACLIGSDENDGVSTDTNNHKSKAAWKLSKKVVEDAWALTQEQAAIAGAGTLLTTNINMKEFACSFDFDDALQTLLTKRATAFVNAKHDGEASKENQLGETATADLSKPQGRSNNGTPEAGGALTKKKKSNGKGDNVDVDTGGGFKSFSLFDLLDKNPGMAAAMDQEPVTASKVMEAYHEFPSADSSGDPGLDRLNRAITMLERVESMQDLIAPPAPTSDASKGNRPVGWKDMVRVLNEGLDVCQVVARQDDDDAIVQGQSSSAGGGNYNSSIDIAGMASSLAAAEAQDSHDPDVNAHAANPYMDEDDDDSGDKNPWGATLQEGDDATLLEQQIQVSLRFIQLYQDLFYKCSREAAGASGLAVSSSNNFVSHKYDLVHSLLYGIVGFFRENSYLLLVLTATTKKRREKILPEGGDDNMSTDEQEGSAAAESKNTEERSTFNLSCRPGLDLAARMVSLCHELLAAFTEDIAYLSGAQIDALFIRYFSLLKILETPPVSLPPSAVSGIPTESASGEEHVVVSGVFHLQPAHFFTALDPTARVFSMWIRQIPPQQLLEYFKFTNLLHDIFTKANPHDGHDILGKQRFTSLSSSSSSVSSFSNAGDGAAPSENDGKAQAKTGLTGSGFGAQHNIIYVALGGGSKNGQGNGDKDDNDSEMGSVIRVQDLARAQFAWSLTALKSCLYTLGPHFPQEGTVHPLSRQLFRMDRLVISEAKPAAYGGLSVRQFDIAPLIEMGGEDNIALIMTFARVLQSAIKSKDPSLVDSNLLKVCNDAIWAIGRSTLMVHPMVFAGGMVHFFLISTSCNLCNSIGVNPLLGTTQCVLAVIRVCDQVLASDPYRTTVPARASSLDLNTYESIVFENMQRVLTFIMNDKPTLHQLRTASLSARRKSMAVLTEIILPMQRLRPRLDIGQHLSSATQQWILMIQVYMQVSSALGMQDESLVTLSQLLGMRPEGWWLIEQALKERKRESAVDGSSAQVIQHLYHEWSLAVNFGDGGVIGPIGTLPLLSCLAASTTNVVSSIGVLAKCVVNDLQLLQDNNDWQQRRGLEHLSYMMLCSFDSHVALQDQRGREAFLELQHSTNEFAAPGTFNLDTLCLLKHHKLLSVDEGHIEFERKESTEMGLDEIKQKLRSTLWNILCNESNKVNLLPMSVTLGKATTNSQDTTTDTNKDLDKKPAAGKLDQQAFFDDYWKNTICDQIQRFYSEADFDLGAQVLSPDDQATANQLMYYMSSTVDDGSDGEAFCVDWFSVLMNGLAGGDCMGLTRFVESLKSMPGIMYLWPRLHPDQVSRKRYLLTMSACVHDVLGKECPEIARALEELCQCPTWSFIPAWMQQNMMGIVSFKDALYILYTSIVHGVDYLAYYAVAVLRHSQSIIVEAAAASQLLHPSMLVPETRSFCAIASEDFVHGLCKKHRSLSLELLAAAIDPPAEQYATMREG